MCVYSMSSIEKAFEGPVKFQIAPGSPVWQQKIIDNRDQFECRSAFKSSSNFHDSSKYQLMAYSVSSNSDPLYVEKLEKFVAEKEMPWPQYFDGKGWSNKFGQQYGITGLPTMWLVDKQGVVREMDARSRLEKKVEELLAE